MYFFLSSDITKMQKRDPKVSFGSYVKEKLPWRTTKNTTKQSAMVIIPTPVMIKLNIRFFLLASFFAASLSSSLAYTLGAFLGRMFNAFSE